MVKLLISEKDAIRGERYFCRAPSISHDEGAKLGLNNENVKWYVGAYFKTLVD